MTTLLVTHQACFEHDPGRMHPESPARLKAILGALEAPEFAALEWRAAPLADVEQIARVHARLYVERVLQAIPSSGYIGFDPDTIASPGSLAGMGRPLRVMACHYSTEGNEKACVGWLANQLGPGNNIPLRICASKGDFGRIELDGEQHKTFEDTLPKRKKRSKKV